MSLVTDLPASARRMFRPYPTIEAEGLLTRQIDRASITWSVPTADTTAFLNVVAGSAEYIGGGVLRVIPLQHPEYPWMLADSFRAERQLWDGTAAFYGYTFVTVNFRSPTWDLDGAAAFLTIRQDEGGRWMQCKSAIALFADGATHPSYDPGIWVPGTNISITMHQLPYLPNSLVQGYMKCVNQNTFWGFDPQTVLWQAPSLVRSTSIAGITTYEATMKFQQSSIPWNQEFKDDGTLDDIYINGALRYPIIDFDTFFQS